MGTRSTTHVYDKGQHLVSIYRQFDGYPDGHGAELADFMRDRHIVNGFGTDTPKKASNGMGCFAASLIAELKDGIGGIYITPPDDRQEYDYFIDRFDSGHLSLRVERGGEVLYHGSAERYPKRWDDNG